VAPTSPAPAPAGVAVAARTRHVNRLNGRPHCATKAAGRSHQRIHKSPTQVGLFIFRCRIERLIPSFAKRHSAPLKVTTRLAANDNTRKSSQEEKFCARHSHRVQAAGLNSSALVVEGAKCSSVADRPPG